MRPGEIAETARSPSRPASSRSPATSPRARVGVGERLAIVHARHRRRERLRPLAPRRAQIAHRAIPDPRALRPSSARAARAPRRDRGARRRARRRAARRATPACALQARPPARAGPTRSAPAIAASSSAASATVRASGPCVSRYGHVGITPVRGTSPNVGFMPTTPVNCAGMRFDPPSSVPKRGERHPARDGDRGSGARAAGRTRARRIVRIAHLTGVAARAVAAIREVVGGGLPEDDRAGGAHPRDFDRVALHGIRKQPRPLGARPGRRQSVHVVDRFREHRNAVERTARAGARVAVASAARASSSAVADSASIACHAIAVGAAAFERPRSDFDRRPVSVAKARDVIRDRPVQGISSGSGGARAFRSAIR